MRKFGELTNIDLGKMTSTQAIEMLEEVAKHRVTTMKVSLLRELVGDVHVAMKKNNWAIEYFMESANMRDHWVVWLDEDRCIELMNDQGEEGSSPYFFNRR